MRGVGAGVLGVKAPVEKQAAAPTVGCGCVNPWPWGCGSVRAPIMCGCVDPRPWGCGSVHILMLRTCSPAAPRCGFPTPSSALRISEATARRMRCSIGTIEGFGLRSSAAGLLLRLQPAAGWKANLGRAPTPWTPSPTAARSAHESNLG
eukprot:358534-Chlamydomonas_euryale.AAC.2